MRNQTLSLTQALLLILFISLLAIGIFITLIADANKDQSTSNTYLMFAITHHNVIMISLVVLAVVFGFLWSYILFREVRKKEETSSLSRETMLRLLDKDEREVLGFLLSSNGSAPQSQISKLPLMGKVKAFRTVQKMKSKGLAHIESNGKLRVVSLDAPLMNLFKPSLNIKDDKISVP